MDELDQPSRRDGGMDRDVDRRTVLKALGAGALVSGGLVGTASGHEVNGEPVFCGCDSLCVCLDGRADVLMARETGDGEYDVGFVVDGGELDPYPDGEPRYSGDFCVSTDDDDVPDGKIIGLQVDGTRWVNPNECAQDALAAEREQLDSTHDRPEGAAGTACDGPPCDDGEIDVRFEDCQTAHVSDGEDRIDQLTVHYTLCFEGDGPCPDGSSVAMTYNPPMTIDGSRLSVDDVPYYVDVIEYSGEDVSGHVRVPDELDCGF